jgi:DNA polymerase-3 subunit alpha
MMAYVTVEDDTASIEMLAFSNVLSQHGGYLKENAAVVVTARLSIRDEKEPQIVINRVRPISDFSEQQPVHLTQEPAGQVLTGTLWLKLSGQDDPKVRKVKAIVKMFPGSSPVKLFFADIRKSSTGSASLDSRMLTELKNVLGEENVVVK